ncbi:camk family protein kinase [Colletotrichum asianum]
MTPTYHNLTGVPDKAGRANRYMTTGVKRDGYQKNVYELHGGHQSNAEDGQNSLMFIRFVGRSPEEKRELERLAKEEVPLSEATAFESVVPYRDYIEEQDMLVVEEANWKGIEPGTCMSEEELLILAADVLSALTYLHDRHQVHGYVHPRNIIRFKRPANKDGDELWGYKLIGHGLVPKVMWTWNDIPGDQFTPPEFRGKKSEYQPSEEGDVWMLGQTLAELHSRSQGGGFDKHQHDQLDDLLKNMLKPTPGERMKAQVALDTVVGQYLTDIYPFMTLALAPLEEAKKRVRRERRGRHVMGRLWLDLKSLLFLVMFWATLNRSLTSFPANIRDDHLHDRSSSRSVVTPAPVLSITTH